MKTISCLLTIAAIVFFHPNIKAQPTFKYGFGGGINFSHITETNSFPLFESISGDEYSSTYASVFSNIGNQYFFHGVLHFSQLVLALKPGTYTSKFSKTDEIPFNTETVTQTSDYLLRYINIPLEIKYLFGQGSLAPFIGGSISYGHLLRQGGTGNHSFIKPKFVTGPILGTYYAFENFDLVLTLGYDYGIHNITDKANRYDTSSLTPYSQSDIKLNSLYATISVLFSIDKQQMSKGGLDCPTPGKTRAPKKRKNTHKRK